MSGRMAPLISLSFAASYKLDILVSFLVLESQIHSRSCDWQGAYPVSRQRSGNDPRSSSHNQGKI